jgi:dTDP-4-dehydrorhamnose reductase
MQDQKRKVFGIGISGLVGSRIVEVLEYSYDFQNLSQENGVDITKPETLAMLQNDTKHDVVIHLAAKTDVDGCEHDKATGTDGAAWKINVEGTRNVVEACQKTGKKLIYLSTDFVFDGTKPEGEYYTEDDEPNPVNWYARTKYKGERIVRDSGLPYLIIRIAYPYRTPFPTKKDLVQAILTRLGEGQQIQAVTDHLMCPTYVDDIASALDMLLRTEATGLYHVVGSQALSPYDLAVLIARTFGHDPSLIQKTTREAFFAGRAPRPFNLSLNNDRIEKLGVKMRTVDQGLSELKPQMDAE